MASKIPLDYPNCHRAQANPFSLRQFLMLGAGPPNISSRVQRALSLQPLHPCDDDMFQLMDEVKEKIKFVFQTKNRLTLAVQVSGNGGNETLVTNLTDAGDRIVIASGGSWGDRNTSMAKRYNINVLKLEKGQGEIFSVEELEAAIVQHQAVLLFVTHGESSGGTLQNLEGLGAMCHKHNCLFAVDAVASIAVEPLFVDRWEIDAVTGGSQKGISAPAGFCVISFSSKAEKRMFEKKQQPPDYFDLKILGKYWKCFDEPRLVYHYTFSSTMLAALSEALSEICEEGLENAWMRHRRTAEYFWKKMEELGCQCFVEKTENRFHGVSSVILPSDIPMMPFLKYIKDKHFIHIIYGYGPTTNKAIRVGLLGYNSRVEVVDFLIEAMRDGLKYCRHNKCADGVQNGVVHV